MSTKNICLCSAAGLLLIPFLLLMWCLGGHRQADESAGLLELDTAVKLICAGDVFPGGFKLKSEDFENISNEKLQKNSRNIMLACAVYSVCGNKGCAEELAAADEDKKLAVCRSLFLKEPENRTLPELKKAYSEVLENYESCFDRYVMIKGLQCEKAVPQEVFEAVRKVCFKNIIWCLVFAALGCLFVLSCIIYFLVRAVCRIRNKGLKNIFADISYENDDCCRSQAVLEGPVSLFIVSLMLWINTFAVLSCSAVMRYLSASTVMFVSSVTAYIVCTVFLYILCIAVLKAVCRIEKIPEEPFSLFDIPGRTGFVFFRYLGLGKFKKKFIADGLCWYGGAFVCALLMSVLTGLFDGSGESSNPILINIVNGDGLDFVFLGFTALSAPFYEEILFRGFLSRGLSRSLTCWGGAAASALLFSLCHGDASGVLILAGLGFAFALAKIFSKSLWPAVIAHFLWNAGVLFRLSFVLMQ